MTWHPAEEKPSGPRYILGVCCFGQNDSGVCLLKDGKIVFAAEGERYSRVKHDNRFPRDAILDALRSEGIRMTHVEAVGFYSDMKGVSAQTLAHMVRYLPRSLRFLRNTSSYLRHRSLRSDLVRSFGYAPPVIPVKHHLTHAASAFFQSPFEKAAILTLDGTGEFTTSTFGIGEGTEVRLLQEVRYPHSLGKLYETFTQFLGFRPSSGEGKVMGLAPYGDPEPRMPLLRRIVREGPEGTFRMDMSWFAYHTGARIMYSRKFVKHFGPPREPEGPLEKTHRDTAAALQKRVEEIALHMVRHLHRMTDTPNLCLAGGVCLNCQMNSVLLEQGPFRDLFVPPAAGDSGTGVGAAKFLYHHRFGGNHREVLRTAFLGPAFSDEECLAAIEEQGLAAEPLDDPADRCARLLAEGRIVGWYQGRMEIGPRALGNRSILADPRDPGTKDRMNERVKFREGFRPFAPAILEDRCGEYFDNDAPSPFMLRVYRVRPEKKAVIPAVVHVDDTCRVQTVGPEDHPLFFRLIRRFDRLTGVPVVLNTSFNLRGEPIVRTPSDAVATFLRSGMDALFLGRFLVEK